jgi:acyl-CoA synthetase (AMP-forming)/AMP-acid ligase II/acyl carrier protein
VFLPQILEQRARAPEDRWSLTFLDSRGAEQSRWTAADLAARARAVAARLIQETKPGEPVLLVFQPGPDFLAAFMGCLWSGRLATPTNPPRRNRLVERLVSVATDSGARVALVGAGLSDAAEEWRRSNERLGGLAWTSLDGLAEAPDLAPAAIGADDIAFIQYTSGSTASPKGVMVSHGNLIKNIACMEAMWTLDPDATPGATLVTWLPAFHDLGLIFGLLHPLYAGCAAVQMAPNTFLQKPVRWLNAISHYRGTHSAAPSFAYDLCCRRIDAEERAGLDLSSLLMTMNAAEPINPAVMERFVEEFRPHGFRREAFAPAYGLAEATLAVTGTPTTAPPTLRTFDVDALGAGEVSILADGAAGGRLMPSSGRILVDGAGGGRLMPGSGRPFVTVAVAVVDPETRRRCPADRIGEIWVGGPSVAQGYWHRPEETAATYGARIEGEEAAGSFLRTGDLGALIDGELFVTGRIKDLIIVSGTNFYPHDIERAAQSAHESLRRDNGAAFAITDDDAADGGREQVALVQELERTRRNDDPAEIFQAILETVWQALELKLSRIVLVPPGAVLRTSSGKIQRLANRKAYLDGTLPVIAEWRGPVAAPAVAAVAPVVLAAAPQRVSADAAAITLWLTGWLADRLNLQVRAIDANLGFAEMGLDSVGSTELAFALGERLGTEVSETIAFDHPTIARLVSHLATATGAPSVSSPVPPIVAAAAHGSDVDDLLTAIERGQV